MDLKEFFKHVGGDYNEVISRLGKEDRIIKYLIRFVESDPLSEFDRALDDNNIEECFRTLHSIKGMCLNLGLGDLGKSSSRLCEEYRNGAPDKDVTDLIEITRNDYKVTVDNINEICLADDGQNTALNIPKDQLERILKKLIQNCEEMFVDGIDSNISELSKCALPENMKEDMEKLVKYADDVSINKIEEVAGNMLNLLK